MRRRRDLFAPDRALQAWMATAPLAAGASAALLVAVVAWLAAAVQWRPAAGVVLLAAGGLAAEARRRGPARDARARPVAPRDERRARELLARLAALGGIRSPQLVCEPDRAALSWTTAVPWRPATIHVTSGLLSASSTRELASVLAHELTHIANRDAWAITMLGPPSWILTGIREGWRERQGSPLRNAIGLAAASWLVLLALPGALAVRLLSRHHELAADRGAALLTGSPAGVAAALRRLSGGASAGPDLRLARLELLNLVPSRACGAGAFARLWATHPPLERRLAQLDRIELALHAHVREESYR
jgi:heat shock protein HtpX